MKIRKMSTSKVIWLLVFLVLLQLFGYVTPIPRWLVASIPNEATAVAQARASLRAWGIPIEDYIFTGNFSFRTRTWTVNVSPSGNANEITHSLEFFAITGWSAGEDINWDLAPPWPE